MQALATTAQLPRLPEASTPVIEAFMSDYRDTLLAERVRADWLRTLARNQDWEAFEREYRKLAVEDLGIAGSKIPGHGSPVGCRVHFIQLNISFNTHFRTALSP